MDWLVLPAVALCGVALYARYRVNKRFKEQERKVQNVEHDFDDFFV